MEPSPRRIEIFAPFGEAFETTKRILFQPFNFTKWLVIGFAAWLTTLFGGGFSFNYRRSIGHNDWNWNAQGHGNWLHNLPPWVLPVAIGGGLLVLALLVLVLWLQSRGRFIFTDCIVHNRGAIVAPWREYRAEGNSYFLFQLAVTFGCMLVFGGLGILFFFGWFRKNLLLPLPVLILLAVIFVLIAILLRFILVLMAPVMYRRRCRALEAFRAVWSLITGDPLIFLLFGLFYCLLLIASAMIGCLAVCLTCCIVAIPYVGTVLLLPLVMFLFTYQLCFLRQFGDSWDVWAVVRPSEPPTLPPTLPVPPVQQPPPSA